MPTLAIMKGDHWKIGDHVYVTKKHSEMLKGGTCLTKKKISTQDTINLKLGVSPSKIFDIQYPPRQNDYCRIFKIISIEQYTITCEIAFHVGVK